MAQFAVSDVTSAELAVLDGITATTTELNYVDGVTSNIQTQLDAKNASITGSATTIDTETITASRALVTDGSGKVAVSDVTSTELGYLDNVTSNIQTQLDAKNASITGSATTIDTETITASRALVTDGSGKVAVSDVTSTELGYLDNVTSNIQTQLDAKNASITGSATTIDTETITASRALITDGSGKVAVSDVTSTELNMLDGGTSATSTTVVDADRLILNDDGTMKQIAVTDLNTYLGSATSIDGLSDAKSEGSNFTGSLLIGHETTGTLNDAYYKHWSWSKSFRGSY